MVRFLIIRFSSIGDIVLTTPVFRMLDEQVDKAEIHFLTKPAYGDLLSANPHIKKIHTLKETANETVEMLKKEEFDYVIDLQNNFRSKNIKRPLKRVSFTVNKINVAKWLMVNFKIDRLPSKHIVDRYLETIAPFIEKVDEKGLDFYIPPDQRVAPGELPEAFQKEGYVVLVIGAKHSTKKLPKEKLVELLDHLDHPVILVGGPEDQLDGEQLLSDTKNRRVLNGCGLWSIHQSASILKQAITVVTHDTGMMHIAAAFKKPIQSIWGNTIPSFGMVPYKPHEDSEIFQVNGLSCRPCSKLGKKECPRKHFDCMRKQEIQAIAKAANKLN